MRYFFLLLMVLSLSCSHKQENTVNQKSTVDSASIDSSLSNYKFDCDKIKSQIKNFNSDSIEIRLTDKELKEKKFLPVGKDFYYKYIRGKKPFQDWNESKKEDYWEVKHYYYGAIKKDNICPILIYEYFTLNHSEDKLYLLIIDSMGELRDVKLVSELTYYPGAVQTTYSRIMGDTLQLFDVVEDVMETEDSNGRYRFEKDSTTLTYDIHNWKSFLLVDSNKIKKEYRK